ncbi:MAG: hypothetical protein HY426_03290 [Candidatus Levybacteria bacterium]|nr:hypothetical protein [Candidatus Levybacteria bacterium]
MKEIENLIHGRPSRRDFFVGSATVLSSLALTACTNKGRETGMPSVTTATPNRQTTPKIDIAPIPTPELSLAQKAMRKGKIEISKEGWDEYFVSVSKEEAYTLTAEARKNGQFRYILPFDPRVEGLSVESFESPIKVGDNVGAMTIIAVKNLPEGTEINSPFDGKSSIGNISTIVDGKPVLREILPSVTNSNGEQFTLYGGLDLGLKEGMTPSDPLKEGAIKLGDFLSTVGKARIRQEGFSIMYDINSSKDFSLARLTNLLTKGGKIVFVYQDKK